MYLLNRIKSAFRKQYYMRIKHVSGYDYKIMLWREAGIEIGDRCHIYTNLSTRRDCTLLHIGNNVTVAGGVKFILHDNAIIKASNGKFTDLLGEIRIDDNVFIGENALVLLGVHLAEGTIVGAGSVVTNSVDQPQMVVAGNPSKIICTVEDYYKRNMAKAFNLDGKSKSDIGNIAIEQKEKLITRKNVENTDAYTRC